MKSMKKALSLFLALSMLMTVCAVNILAEDTVTLTVPNGNFANQTSAENGTLPDGWVAKPYSGSTLGINTLCYAIGTFENGGAQTSPNSTLGETQDDGSYSFMLKNPGNTGFLMIESPKISLENNSIGQKKNLRFPSIITFQGVIIRQQFISIMHKDRYTREQKRDGRKR